MSDGRIYMRQRCEGYQAYTFNNIRVHSYEEVHNSTHSNI